MSLEDIFEFDTTSVVTNAKGELPRKQLSYKNKVAAVWIIKKK